MKLFLIIISLVMAISCNVNAPIKIVDNEDKKLSEFEKKLDANNPKEKFIVSFIGVYKNDEVRLLVDGKELFNKKLRNQFLSSREFLDSYIGDKPKQNIQIFINDQSVTIDASKIEDKRYIIIDKDSSKQVILSKSPSFKGSDNLYVDPSTRFHQRAYLE